MSKDQLHFHREGQALPTVVFVHGLTCDHTDWSQQIRSLSTSADCVAVDLRGHGKSVHLPPDYRMDQLADDVVSLCHDIGVSSAVFVGHSMGTRVITAIAKQAPSLVNGLILVDGSRFADGDAEQIRQTALDQLGDDQQTTTFVKSMFAAMFTESSDKATQKQIINRAVNTSPEIFRQLFSNLHAWDAASFAPALEQITQPITVLQSTTVNEKRERRSMQASESSAYLRFIAETAPHAEITVIPDIGHFTQLEAAARVNQAVQNLLAS